jgi:hypothetical protein
MGVGALHRVHSTFSPVDFKEIWKMIFFRNYVIALKNHNLLILAPKIMKQIL